MREQRRNETCQTIYRSKRYKTQPKPCDLENIRDWKFEEMLLHIGRFANACVVSGIPLGDIKLHCDRIQMTVDIIRLILCLYGTD